MGPITTFTFRTMVIIVQPKEDMVTVIPRCSLMRESTATLTIDQAIEALELRHKKTEYIEGGSGI